MRQTCAGEQRGIAAARRRAGRFRQLLGLAGARGHRARRDARRDRRRARGRAPAGGRGFAAPGRGRAACPRERSWGFAVQLYSLRSRGSWGHGDLRDLADLAAWSARDLGAGFVLINPLHAAEPLPPVSPSPYLPMSRRWVSPLYLRIEDIPEYAETQSSRTDAAYLSSRSRFVPRRRRRRSSTGTRSGPPSARRSRCCARCRCPTRGRRRSMSSVPGTGAPLPTGPPGARSRRCTAPTTATWPARLRDPRSAEAEVRRGDLAAQAEFHVWVQWLVAAQVAAAQAAARAAGMEIGIIADLAIGAHPGGADAWAGQEYFATRVHRRRAAGRVQPARPGLGAAADAPPRARGRRVPAAGRPHRRQPRPRRRTADRPRHGAVPAVVDPGGRAADRGARTCTTTRRARSAPSPRPPLRPGPSSSARTSAPWSRGCASARRPRRARHEDALVRARLVRRAARPAVVAGQQPGDRLHARPAARRGVPVRDAGHRPPGARPADPLRGRGARRGRPHRQRLDRRARRPRACCRPASGRRPTSSPPRFTATWPGRRPCSSASTWPRRPARPAPRTCRAPATSTRTGSSRSAAPAASPSSSRTWQPATASAPSPAPPPARAHNQICSRPA